MIDHSRLYTFIDQEKKFALYFLEGQRLIHDLALKNPRQQGGFPYFRAAVLSVQLLLGLLKHGEYFCFYLDAEKPYFRLKIEMNTQGLMRGMIYADALSPLPSAVSGTVRLIKFQPHADMPYQSTIDLDQVSMDEIMNQVLERSYQVNSRIFISSDSDQSIMLHQLPLTSKETPSDLTTAFTRYVEPLKALMARGLTDPEDICDAFAELGFQSLASQKVAFNCGCSKKQMIANLLKFIRTNDEPLFSPGQETIDVTCEYCKTVYRISEKEMGQAASAYQ